MEHIIAKLHKEFENGKMSRRELIQCLAVTGMGAFAASAAPVPPPAGKGFRTTAIHHLAYGGGDYVKRRDFYVDLFGMKVVWDDGKRCMVTFGNPAAVNGINFTPVSKPGDKPTVGHTAFSIANFMDNKAAVKAEMERRGLKYQPDSARGWTCTDPAGYTTQVLPFIAADYSNFADPDASIFPGGAGGCKDNETISAECKAAEEAGLKNLSAIPKPGGKGFTATAFSYILMNVPEPDIPKERDFYRDFFEMKVISDKQGGPNPECVLRFGANTLCFRKTSQPGDMPYLNQFGFVVENYDQAKVGAELKRRGLNPELDSKLGWTIADPDGLRIGISGKAVV